MTKRRIFARFDLWSYSSLQGKTDASIAFALASFVICLNIYKKVGACAQNYKKISYLCTHRTIKRNNMPEICHFYGIVITMYLPDHNPPHFHVRYNEYRAIIDIQTGKVTGQMPRRALHLVFEWLDLHKDELMENWERMENGETLAKINPLD